MIHVVCTKWGNKYSWEYVNRLYDMVKRYLNADFKFYCQTDVSTGLYSNIEIIPFTDSKLPYSEPQYERTSLWDRPKLNYFNPDFIEKNELKIALDLDLIIHNNMKPLLDLMDNKAITGRSWWHNMNLEAKPQWKRRYGARNNGGFYMWYGEQTKPIWDDLLENYERIYFCFKGGSDNFITTRHFDLFDFVPPSMYYSFNRGCEWPDDIGKHEIRKDKIICVFNTDPGDATNFDIHEAILLYPEVAELWT